MNLWWKDKQLMQELKKRSSDLETGKDKGISWEELKEKIKTSFDGNSDLRNNISPENESAP